MTDYREAADLLRKERRENPMIGKSAVTGEEVRFWGPICPICQAEWKDEEPPCIHLDLDSDWDGE